MVLLTGTLVIMPKLQLIVNDTSLWQYTHILFGQIKLNLMIPQSQAFFINSPLGYQYIKSDNPQ